MKGPCTSQWCLKPLHSGTFSSLLVAKRHRCNSLDPVCSCTYSTYIDMQLSVRECAPLLPAPWWGTAQRYLASSTSHMWESDPHWNGESEHFEKQTTNPESLIQGCCDLKKVVRCKSHLHVLHWTTPVAIFVWWRQI